MQIAFVLIPLIMRKLTIFTFLMLVMAIVPLHSEQQSKEASNFNSGLTPSFR